MLIAHIREVDCSEQTVAAHLSGVASLARRYGAASDVGALAELAGFLHDMGKFTEHFSVYLRNAVLEHEVAAQKIDHSTAGAKYLYERYYGQAPLQNLVVETVGMAILSHHSGMQNFVQPDLKPSDYLRRVQDDELPFYEEVVQNFERLDGYRERVDGTSMQITKSVNSVTNEKDPSQKTSDTMGMKHRVDFGVYVFYGSINPQLAERTGFTQEDAEKLKEALKTLFANDASSARPDGSMEVNKVFWWEHNSKLGQYSSAAVHRTVQVKKEHDEYPLTIENYSITTRPLEGLHVEEYDGL